MGYTGTYSLAAPCGSEMIGSGLVIWLGESVLANEVLGKTKGNGMGFGWVAYGWGLAFFFPLLCLSYISAHLNPAMCLALWILGRLGPGDCFALSASEFAGMFLAACLVWLHYFPHFKTLPEPPTPEVGADYVRTRDVLSRDALHIASYSTFNTARVKTKGLKSTLKDIQDFLTPETYDPEHLETIDRALGLHDRGTLRRTRSVQVADMHERLKEQALQDRVRHMRDELVGLYRHSVMAGNAAHQPHPDPMPEAPNFEERSNNIHMVCDGSDTGTATVQLPEMQIPGPKSELGVQGSKDDTTGEASHNKRKLDKACQGALVADQNAKLSIFATRPAIYAPALNWLAEFGGTFVLIAGALLIEEREKQIANELRPLFATLSPLFIGLMVQLIILGMGGPTGVAINPARDLAPRVAHHLLPIPNKGHSEWHYAWVPLTAPLCAGAAAAGIFRAINSLNHSSY